VNARIAVIALAALVPVLSTGCADTYGYGHRRETHVSVAASYGSYDEYDALSPYGTWVQVSYGWAWCPLDVAAGWRPYTVGRWVYSDWGWMWLSDDPWGAIPYHYGRWSFDDYYGWVWIPGDVWAPAWVSWRYGDGWIGWAPLPPDVTWHVTAGFAYSSSAIDGRIDPDAWCFVPERRFGDTRLRSHVAPPSRNVTLLRGTENVTRYEVVRTMPAERGLKPEWVERGSGRSVTRYDLVDSDSPRRRGAPAIRGRTVEIFRPRLEERGKDDDRVRREPPERLRSRPPERLVERQQSEGRLVAERLREERAALKRIQDEERRRPPRGASGEELKRRHEAEERAQREREERLRKVYERRAEKFRDAERADRGRGRDERERDDRGRGRDERDRPRR
jgi:hypothetical protein